MHLSVLLPTHDNDCTTFVRHLHQQATQLQQQTDTRTFQYEIIILDDASTDPSTITANQTLNTLHNVRLVPLTHNIGRPAARNHLTHLAQGDTLLYADSDLDATTTHYLANYILPQLHHPDRQPTVRCGGLAIPPATPTLRQSLRYRIEAAARPRLTPERRNASPYQHFHCSNLLMPATIARSHPFDERIRRYGYEDTLLGRNLHDAHIPVQHIDNPLTFTAFDPNSTYLDKTDQALQVLHDFQTELRGYSPLITLHDRLRHAALTPILRLAAPLLLPCLRAQLCTSHPILQCFNLYRLLRYASL